MKKFLLFSIALLTSWSGLHAQSIDAFKTRLSLPDSIYRVSVSVFEHGSAASAIDRYQLQKKTEPVINGYRIRIFFDNSQNARTAAGEVQENFKTLFPDIPVYLSYDAPSFFVWVGNCMNIDEALVLWGKIKNHFDKAFPVRQEIPLAEFLK